MDGFIRTVRVLDVLCLRFFYCLMVFILILNRRVPDTELNRFYYDELYFHLQGIRPFVQISINQFIVLAALIFSALNVAPRFFLVLASISYMNLVYLGNLRLNLHDDSLIPIVLLLLACMPKIQNPFKKNLLLRKVDSLAPWLIKATLACVYLSAFGSKLSNTGISWANGIHLQNYLFERYALGDNSYALWLSQHPALCKILSSAAVLAEGVFWIVLFFPKLEKWIVPAGLCMHLFIWICFDINFFPGFVITYLAFVPFSKIFFRARRLTLFRRFSCRLQTNGLFKLRS